MIFPINRSKYLLILFALIYGGAAGSVCFTALGLLIKIIFLSILLIYGIYYFNRYIILYSPKSIIRITYDEPHWQLENKSGEIVLTELLGNSTIGAYFLILRFQNILNRRHHAIIVFPDTLSQKNFRLLRSIINFSYPV